MVINTAMMIMMMSDKNIFDYDDANDDGDDDDDDDDNRDNDDSDTDDDFEEVVALESKLSSTVECECISGQPPHRHQHHHHYNHAQNTDDDDDDEDGETMIITCFGEHFGKRASILSAAWMRSSPGQPEPLWEAIVAHHQ